MRLFRDLMRRLRGSWRWVFGQFGGNLLLIVLVLAWTRLPEKHLWQVGVTLLLPVLLAISALELQAGTMRSLGRSFADADGRRVKLVWGAVSLLVWVGLAALAWAFLNWCDGRLLLWAGYLNSKAPAGMRAKLLTFQHIQLWMRGAEWFLLWVATPAKVIPFAMSTAEWGWRMPWKRTLKVRWNWRWWLGVAVAALVGVWVPGLLFAKLPSGSVTAQVWAVALKLVVAYGLAVGSWVLLLGWAAVLFGRRPGTGEDEALVPAVVGPPDLGRAGSVKLPLPEDG